MKMLPNGARACRVVLGGGTDGHRRLDALGDPCAHPGRLDDAEVVAWLSCLAFAGGSLITADRWTRRCA